MSCKCADDAETKITPEMIEAGVDAYLEWLDKDTVQPEFGRLENLVRQILVASLQRPDPKILQDHTLPERRQGA